MSDYAAVQCHFVKDVINHRLRFGQPDRVIKLDPYRRLALFRPGATLSYIRWRANQYGTQDWRLYVVIVGGAGNMTRVPGITPAVNVLVSVQGIGAVKRALSLLDRLETKASGGFERVPESYWRQFQTGLLLKLPMRELPRSCRTFEACRAG